MRNIHFIVLSILLSITQISWNQKQSAHVKYFAGTLSQALEVAQTQNKPVFIKGYTDWCGYCKLLDRKTLADEGVASYLNAHFINLRVNMERADGPEIANKYRIKGFPTMLVLSPTGKELDRYTGFRDAATLKPELEKAIDTFKKRN